MMLNNKPTHNIFKNVDLVHLSVKFIFINKLIFYKNILFLKLTWYNKENNIYKNILLFMKEVVFYEKN